MTAEVRQLLRVRQVAAVMQVSQNSIYELIGSGQLRAVRLGRGRSIRIRPEAIEDYLHRAEDRAGD